MSFLGKNKNGLVAIALLALTACGGGGGDTPVENIAPKVSVADLTVAEDSAVSITVNASDDDGTVTGYSWVRKSGEEVELSGTDSNTVTFTSPLLLQDSNVVLTITVTDDKGATTSKDVTVTIIHTNIAPTVTVESSSFAEGSDASLTAIVEDTDGTIQSYAWTQVSGEPLNLETIDGAQVTFTVPALTENTEAVLSVTVTDDDGATGVAEVTVTLSANLTNLVVNGLVTDAPVANANVLFTVGENEFTATADENGQYSITLSVDDSMTQQMVKATATGTGSDSTVKLTSLFGTFESMNSLSGDDGILDKTEMFAVNITNISTSVTAMMELSNGGLISDNVSFELAAKNYNGSYVLPMATSIKLVMDYSSENAGLALPEGVADTAALVADLETAENYIYSAKANFETEYNLAEQAILNDVELISSGINNTVMPIADTYYFVYPQGNSGGGRLILNDDASGTLVDLNGDSEFNWSVTASGVALTYPTGKFVESVELSGANDDVVIETISTGKTVRWLSQTAINAQLLIKNTTYRHYPNGELEDEDPVDTETIVNSIKSVGVLNAADILQLNIDYALPTPRVNEEIVNPKSESVVYGELVHRRSSAKMKFSGSIVEGGSVTMTTHQISGDGTKSNLIKVMDWNINDDGHLLVTGEQTFDYVFLTNNFSGKKPYVNVMINENSAKSTISDNGLLKEMPAWTNESAVGIYDYAWESYSDLIYFWVEVNADGTSLTVSATDNNSNGTIDSDEFYEMPGMWQINSEGNLVVRRYRVNSLVEPTFAYCTPAEFDPADDADCLLFHEREWDLHQVIDSTQYHMNHSHRFFDDAARAWMQDPSVSGHILGLAMTDIRYWNKIDARPIELPVKQSAAVKSLGGLQKSALPKSALPKNKLQKALGVNEH